MPFTLILCEELELKREPFFSYARGMGREGARLCQVGTDAASQRSFLCKEAAPGLCLGFRSGEKEGDFLASPGRGPAGEQGPAVRRAAAAGGRVLPPNPPSRCLSRTCRLGSAPSSLRGLGSRTGPVSVIPDSGSLPLSRVGF